MRKYLFSGAVLGSLFALAGLVRATIAGPRGWRLVLMWVAWAASLGVALLAVQQESKERTEYYEK